MVLRPRGQDYDSLDKAVVYDALLVWTKDSMLWFCCLALDRPSSCFIVTVMFILNLCIVRSLRVTVTINKVLSCLTSLTPSSGPRSDSNHARVFYEATLQKCDYHY